MRAEEMRSALSAGRMDPEGFRAALLEVAENERDAWLDRVFDIESLPNEDGPDLPRGCVPYLPSPVSALLRMIEAAQLSAHDVFVDLGSGLGRATALTHWVTGADAVGIEIQPELVRGSRALAARLNTERVSVVEGDAADLTRHISRGNVFFLYCPFSGERLERVLGSLESVARKRVIRVCSLDLPLPARAWLTPVSLSGDLSVYRSVAPSPTAAPHGGSAPVEALPDG